MSVQENPRLIPSLERHAGIRSPDGPYHPHRQCSSQAIEKTAAQVCSHVICPGALSAADQDALNTWVNTWHDGFDTIFQADLHELKQLLWRLGEWFTDMDAIVGNHDLRIAKATQGQITLDMLIEDTGLQLGQYSYLYLWNPANKEWTYVCHQFNYSKTSVKLAQDVWTVVTAPDGYDKTRGNRFRATIQFCTDLTGRNATWWLRIPISRRPDTARTAPGTASGWAACATNAAPNTPRPGPPSSHGGTAQ